MPLPLLNQSSRSLAEYIVASRWGGVAGLEPEGAFLEDSFSLNAGTSLALVCLKLKSGQRFRYLLGLERAGSAETGFSLETETGTKFFREVLGEGVFVCRLLQAMQSGTLSGHFGRLSAQVAPEYWNALCECSNVKALSGEQSNTTVLADNRWLLKFYRKMNAGLQPEIELGAYLTQAGFEHIPQVMGSLEYKNGTESYAIALVQDYLSGARDGWSLILDQLQTESAEIASEGGVLAVIESLGSVTARMHALLAQAGGSLSAQPADKSDRLRWKQALLSQWSQAKEALQASSIGGLDDAAVERLADGWITSVIECSMTRYHGDYHLGQTLYKDGQWYVIDFEGEPTKTFEERRQKSSPLRDVAGMLRSLSYAAWSLLLEDPGNAQKKSQTLLQWESSARRRFIQAYLAHPGIESLYPGSQSDFDRMLVLFELEKALYELNYEARHRPDWVQVPLSGIQRVIERCHTEERP